MLAWFYSAGCNEREAESFCGLGDIAEEVASLFQIFDIVLLEFKVAVGILHFTQVDTLVAAVDYKVYLRPVIG